jgi:phage shock protein PspC (stress-responsive transcriptional regulator)
LFTGVGFIGYIAAWIIVPPKPIATSWISYLYLLQ